MKRIPTLALILLLGASLLTGCVTHSLFIDLTSTGGIRYVIEGDSVDVYDGRVRHPWGETWSLVDRTSGMNADSSLTIRLDYRAPIGDSVRHPLAPRGVDGVIDVERKSGFLIRSTILRVTFPSWDVSERFGDPEAFIPDEVKLIEEAGADTSLSAENQEELNRIKAVGMQKAAAQRYLKQAQALVESWFSVREVATPDSVLSDAMTRFSGVLQAHLITLHSRDPLDVSLEWYATLKGAMVIAAVEATGGDEEWFSAHADSLELEYKSWMDLEDDGIEVTAVLPAWRVVSNADTTSGDTLYWEVSREMFADGTLVLSAIGYSPVPVTSSLVLLLLLAGVTAGLIRLRRRRSLPAEKR